MEYNEVKEKSLEFWFTTSWIELGIFFVKWNEIGTVESTQLDLGVECIYKGGY